MGDLRYPLKGYSFSVSPCWKMYGPCDCSVPTCAWTVCLWKSTKPESVFSVLDKQNLLSHGGYVPAVIGPFSIHGFHPHLPSAQGSRKWNPLKPSAFAFATLQRGRCTSGSTSFGPPSSWPAKEQIEMPVVRGIILAIPRNPWYDRGKACRFRPHLRV